MKIFRTSDISKTVQNSESELALYFLYDSEVWEGIFDRYCDKWYLNLK